MKTKNKKRKQKTRKELLEEIKRLRSKVRSLELEVEDGWDAFARLGRAYEA